MHRGLVPSYRTRFWIRRNLRCLRECLLRPSTRSFHDQALALRAFPGSRYVRGISGAQGAHPPGKVAVLLTPCAWPDFTVPACELGMALERRNHEVLYLTSRNGFDSWYEPAAMQRRRPVESCISTLRERVLTPRRPLQCLDALRTREVTAHAAQWLSSNADIPIKDLVYEGVPLWDVVKGTHVRKLNEPFLLPGDARIGDDEELTAMLRAAIEAHEACTRYLKSHSPGAVIIYNGLFLLERMMREAALSLGIRVLAHESSSFRNRYIFDATGMIGNRTTVAERSWPAIEHETLNDQQRQRLETFLGRVYAGRNARVPNAAAGGEGLIRERLGIEPGRKIALLIGQLPVDTVMVYDLRFFSGLLDFIRTTMQCLEKAEGWTLVVRLHPEEGAKFGDLTWKQLMADKLPDHVRVVRGQEVNTYALMRMAGLGLTSTSQAGLEMASMHKPVVVVGRAFYAGKGFTLDATRRDRFEPCIREAMRMDGLPPDQVERLNRFLYHVIFEHQLPFDPVNRLLPPAAVDRVEHMLATGQSTTIGI